MKDIVVKRFAKSPIRWGVQELDEMTLSLPEHGSLLIIAPESEVFDALWNLISGQVFRGLNDDGYDVQVLEGDKENLLDVEDRIFQTATDLLLVRCSDSRALSDVCDVLARIPCGFVMLSRRVPNDWQDTADLMLVFQNGTLQVKTVNRMNDRTLGFNANLLELTAMEDAKIQEKQSEHVSSSEYLSSTHESPLPALSAPRVAAPSPLPSQLSSSVQAPFVGARLALIGVNGELENLVRKQVALHAIACESFEISQVRRKGESPAENYDWVVVSGSMSEANFSKFVETNAPLTRMILVATKRMRSSDCARAYQLGIKLVLSVDSEIEERFAAICAQLLPLKKDILDPFQEVDLEYARLSSRFKKRLYWSTDETSQATVHFFPMLSNQMRRATLTGQSVGALVVELPEQIPHAAGFQSLQLLVQRSVVGAMFQLLRERDLSFVIGNNLIILSHHMNSFTARAILKRLCGVLRDLGIEQVPQGKIIRAQMPDRETAPEEAKRFLRKIFATFEK